MPISHLFIPTRPLLVLHRSPPASPHPAIPPSIITLASFLNRHPRPTNRSRRHARAQSQPPQTQFYTAQAPPPASTSSIPRINQANPNEPYYNSVSNSYPKKSQVETNPTQFPPRADLEHHTPLYYEAHPVIIPTQELHCYYPQEIYLSSVLPTRTPRELRYLQDHCWKLYTHATHPQTRFTHSIDESYRITTSPLHFQNLLWRYITSFHDTGITEEYYWIKRSTRHNLPDRPYLEPAYSVFYPWIGTYWKVTQLDRRQRRLPNTPPE